MTQSNLQEHSLTYITHVAKHAMENYRTNHQHFLYRSGYWCEKVVICNLKEKLKNVNVLGELNTNN